jgi:hypothetical protein
VIESYQSPRDRPFAFPRPKDHDGICIRYHRLLGMRQPDKLARGQLQIHRRKRPSSKSMNQILSVVHRKHLRSQLGLPIERLALS